MTYRYIPVLRWKRGEKTGLRYLTVGGRTDVIPLFILGTDRYVGRTPARGPAVPAAAVLTQELSNTWGSAPFFLDASAVSPPAGATHHPLIDIGAQARSIGLQIIPATRLTAPILYQQAVTALHQLDQHGVGLRVDLQEFTSAASWTPAWGIPLEQTDLIVDFADNVGPVNSLGSALNHAFMNVHAAGQWRSITIVGTSMPENFSGVSSGVYTISRLEWSLWQRLSGLAGLPFRLDYGDYATIAIVPPPSGIAWGFPINVKYTTQADFLICRGVATTGPAAVDMAPQLIGHARQIRAYGNRMPLGHCWSDATIDDIATTVKGPGNLETWVTIGVNRHVELIRHLLP
jgi:hypothetical protein